MFNFPVLGAMLPTPSPPPSAVDIQRQYIEAYAKTITAGQGPRSLTDYGQTNHHSADAMRYLTNPQSKEQERGNRCGKFSLPSPNSPRQEWVNRAALQNCVVVKAEMNWATQFIEYIALHPDFDVCAPEVSIPAYVMDMRIDRSSVIDGITFTEHVVSATWRLVSELGDLGATAITQSLKVAPHA